MKKRFATLLLLLVLVMAAIPVLAGASNDASVPPKQPESPPNFGGEFNVNPIGSWPFGPAGAVAAAADRDLVFLSSGGAVLVLDVSDPSNPALLSDEIRTFGYIYDLYYEADRQMLYIAAGLGGLEIWDVNAAAAPIQMSATEIYYGGVDIPVEGVVVVDRMAYIAGDWGYLHWVDVSDPSAPQQRGFNGQLVRPTAVTAANGSVYAVGQDTGAFFEGDFATFAIRPDGGLSATGGRDFGICYSAAVAGNHAFVGCGAWYILDLTSFSFDTVASLSINANATLISGTMAFVAESATGINAVDLTAMNSPQVVDTYTSPGWATDLARIDNYIYLADGNNGLRVVDVADPTNMSEVGFWETPDLSWNADVQGSYAYIANGEEGLLVLDVSDPAAAALAGQSDTPGAVYDVAVEGDYAYIADVTDGLRVVDVSDPNNPVEIAYDDSLELFRIAAAGQYVYAIESVPNQPYWLHIYDVANPAQPMAIGTLQLPTSISRIVAQGDYVYISDWNEGLHVVDVSNPVQPVEVASFPVEDLWDIAIDGAYAYLASADWNGGFIVLNIADPTAPYQVAIYNPSGWFHPYHVGVGDGYAYVSRLDQVHLFDIADPNQPQFLGQFDLPHDSQRLNVVGSTLYATTWGSGLSIYDNLDVLDQNQQYLPLAIKP